jgi:hypothetical protein
MFLKRTKVVRPIAEGAVFRRTVYGRIVETARVLSVTPDGAGIPHVQFSLQADLPDAMEEMRTLALSTFFETFRERVGA